jgi:hypothetical protein
MAENIINKLTVKSVFGKIPTIIVKVTDPVSKEVSDVVALEKDLHLMRIYGQATGYRVATSQYGDSSVFKGVFKAINPSTSEISTAGECCLPKSVENQLAAILNAADGAEFAFDVWAIPAKNAYGYEYRVKSVPGVDVAPAPVISALEAKMGMLQLDAPKPAADEAASKAATGKKK